MEKRKAEKRFPLSHRLDYGYGQKVFATVARRTGPARSSYVPAAGIRISSGPKAEKQKQVFRSAYPTDKMLSAGPHAASLRMTLLKNDVGLESPIILAVFCGTSEGVP
jgi:hypothetical protein